MRGVCLGLDVGDVRVGVAVSDALGLSAQPLETLEGARKEIVSKLLNIIAERRASEIAVGLPVELDGEEGEQCKKTREFIQLIEAALAADPRSLKCRIAYVDERLTSRQAEAALVGSKLKGKDRRKALDRISAAIILETYLQSSG